MREDKKKIKPIHRTIMDSYLSSVPLTSEFLLSFRHSHYSSLVSNLRIKRKQGVPVWIDVQKISLYELRQLDSDEEIERLIQGKQVTYRDR